MKASGTQTPFLVLCPMYVIKQPIFYQRLNLYVMMKFKLFFIVLFCSLSLSAFSQLTYGTTGLLHAPSAEMQRDKTFMVGGNFLNKELTPPTWYYHTYNYFLNVTIFPFLEVAYTCTLFKAEALGLKPYGYSGFTNQDRYFFRPSACVEGGAVLEIHAGCRAGDVRPVHFFRWRPGRHHGR